MSLKGALEKSAEAHSIVADELDRIGASIRGIHSALGEMHSETQAKLDGIIAAFSELRGIVRNVQTAAMIVADVNARVRIIEEALNVHADNGNGTS